MRIRAQSGLPLRAHSVAEELLVTFCEQEASALIELSGKFYEIGDETSGTGSSTCSGILTSSSSCIPGCTWSRTIRITCPTGMSRSFIWNKSV